jgi:hypothetical protein
MKASLLGLAATVVFQQVFTHLTQVCCLLSLRLLLLCQSCTGTVVTA